jgi:hypothetical protein
MDKPTPPIASPGWLKEREKRAADGSVAGAEDQRSFNMDDSTLASGVLPEDKGKGDSVCHDVAPHQIVESGRVQQTFHNNRDSVRGRKIMLSCRNRVQKGRRRLLNQRFELQQLRSQIEILEDNLVRAFEGQVAQVDTHFKLSGQLEQVKAMRKEIKTREHAYNIAEDKLYSDELELGTKENEFYQAFELDSFDAESQASLASASSPILEELYATDEHLLPRTINPLYEYDRKISLAHYLHDKIADLTHDREEILEEQRQRGPNEKMDQDDVDFLETYSETFAGMVTELDAVEVEISNLEKGAISSGLLHPSDTYSRTWSWSAVPESFEIPAIYPSDRCPGGNSLIEMSVELPNSGEGPVSPARSLPGFQLSSTLIRAADVRRWLNDHAISQLQNSHRPSSVSDRLISEPLDKNWVYVVRAHSEPETGMPAHPQTAPPPGDRQPHDDGPVVEDDSSHTAPEQLPSDPGLSSSSPRPNATRISPLKPCDDAPKSRSV